LGNFLPPLCVRESSPDCSFSKKETPLFVTGDPLGIFLFNPLQPPELPFWKVRPRLEKVRHFPNPRMAMPLEWTQRSQIALSVSPPPPLKRLRREGVVSPETYPSNWIRRCSVPTALPSPPPPPAENGPVQKRFSSIFFRHTPLLFLSPPTKFPVPPRKDDNPTSSRGFPQNPLPPSFFPPLEKESPVMDDSRRRTPTFSFTERFGSFRSALTSPSAPP